MPVPLLTAVSFRKTAACTKYQSMLAEKTISPFPCKRMKGKEVSLKWLESDGLKEPLIVEEACSTLGMKMIDSSTKLSDVANMIDPNMPIKFIEVGEQEEVSGYTIGDYAHYLENRTPDHKILNLISLEFR